MQGPNVTYVLAEYAPDLDATATRVRLQAEALVRRSWSVRVLCGEAREEDVLAARASGIEVLTVAAQQAGPYTPTELPSEVFAELAASDLVHVHLGRPLFSNVVRRTVEHTRVWVELDDWHVACGRGDRLSPQTLGACPSGEETQACATCLAPRGTKLEHVLISEQLRLRKSELTQEVQAAGRVLVPSRTHLVRLAEHLELQPERVRIVSPNQGLSAVPNPATRAPWRGDGPLRLLHHGPRRTSAGLLELVRGLALLPADRVQLVLVGEQAERGIDDRLRNLAGDLPLQFLAPGTAELRRQAARCHAAVFPSRGGEGYPIVVDEALALGLPVLACSADAAAERYGSDGLEQLDPRSPDAWTDLIGTFLRRPGELVQLAQGVPTQVAGPADTVERLQTLYVNHASPGQSRAS